MRTCPQCKRKRRVVTSLMIVKKKKYWVSKCVECKTPITMEEKDEPTSR